jgi:hypothetical protein
MTAAKEQFVVKQLVHVMLMKQPQLNKKVSSCWRCVQQHALPHFSTWIKLQALKGSLSAAAISVVLQ